MTDIVPQLRDVVSKGSPFGYLMKAAAEEIESLRAGIRTYLATRDGIAAAREKRLAEVIQERDALLKAEPVAWRWRFLGESSWTIVSKRPKHADDSDVICEPLCIGRRP
ncbi:hypothetical protein IVB18_26290 [Bradyrhizobium sp. 186]|uniref:hypothetical protein n=1 Tax=Bradyrhizobium sp. 186 TaxID=2782654 RepID=UPI002000F3B4|nr:hypothetical protein [Bradyrhizobium sp. 186]UPK31840.1 hypothetical protein IVB18_26290 [Bradyrhizobium sp. 186]